MPSDLISRGTSLDVLIADIGQNWEHWQHERAEAKSKGLPPPAPKMSEAEMTQMMENVRKMKQK